MSQQPNVLKFSLVIFVLLGFAAYVVYSLNSEEFHAMRKSAQQARDSMDQARKGLDDLKQQQLELETKAQASEVLDSQKPTYWPTPQLALDALAKIKEAGKLPTASGVTEPAPKPDLELLSSKGSTNEFSTTITGKIKNNTVQSYTYVQVLFDVYDSGGSRVGSAMGNINNLGPLETWNFKAVYFGGDGHRFRLGEITGF